MLSLIRDEIFEIALGPHAASTPTERILDIRRRTLETYNRFPPSVSIIEPGRPDDVEDYESSFSQILIQLEYLQNLFYVDRLLFNRHCHEEDLLGHPFNTI
ncbi:hypothetical protein LQW54_008683 [Pestalotiopsis sp. IQ-011]